MLYYLYKGARNMNSSKSDMYEIKDSSKNSTVLIVILIGFSAILILVIGFKNNEKDYTKYKNYVMISKDELKEYKELIAKYKKEIRHLKSKKSSLVVDKKCKVCYYNKS